MIWCLVRYLCVAMLFLSCAGHVRFSAKQCAQDLQFVNIEKNKQDFKKENNFWWPNLSLADLMKEDGANCSELKGVSVVFFKTWKDVLKSFIPGFSHKSYQILAVNQLPTAK